MAAVKLANSATLSGPSSRPRGLLVETMQIVEPKKHPPVPNHLLSSSKLTKLYLCNMLVKFRFTLRVMHTVDDSLVLARRHRRTACAAFEIWLDVYYIHCMFFVCCRNLF